METIQTAIIYRCERARPLVEKNIAQIEASIKEVGLLNPIILRPVHRYHAGLTRDVYEIVAGGHRFEAVRRLGWTEVSCKIMRDASDLQIELAEIDENLVRSNLSAAQEAAAMARRKEIYEELHPDTKNGRNQFTGGLADAANPNFTKATADATGRSERTVRAAVTRGERLGGDLDLISGTSLDNTRDLDSLSRMDADERKPLIDRARAGEHVRARKEPKVAADPLDDVMVSEKQVARLMDAWNAAGPEARQEFMLRIDQPVMDRRFGTA